MRLDSQNGELRSHTSGIVKIAAVAVVVIVLAGLGDVAWNRYWRRAGPSNAGFDCPTVVKARRSSPLSRTGVHRVTLIGDSIMFQASCALADSLAGVGITTARHAVSNTGLLTGTVDWVTRARDLVRLEHPDIVMAIFVGNYPTPIEDGHGHVVQRGSPTFFHAWQARAELLSAVVKAGHARLYWVSPPPIGVPLLFYAPKLFDGYRNIPGDASLDSGRVLAGPHGQEVTAKETCGRTRRVRSVFDGVHLTPDGARIYGEQIAHDLTASRAAIPTPRPC